MSDSPELIVIVLNYQNAFVTKACIASILPTLSERMQLLLVDNGSKDGSLAEIMRAFPDIYVHALPENLGFAGGFNAGIERALENGADRILLANNDTVFEKDTIAELMKSEWDVAVPKILFFDRPEMIWSAGARWRSFPPAVVMRGYLKQDAGQYDRPVPLEYATGCVFLAKQEVFRRVGGFDLHYQNYMEDYDFFYRVRKAGFSVGYVPRARLCHRVSQTLGAKSDRLWTYMGRNTVLFYRKNRRFAGWQLWIYLAWVTVRELLRGRLPQLRNFWSGVKKGFSLLGE